MQGLTRSAALALVAIVAIAGCKGEDGARGPAGDSCSIADNGDGTATITCPSGTYTVSNGDPGVPGDPCTMVDNLDGTGTITCGTTTYTVGTKKQTVESCAGCHNASLPTTHDRALHVSVTNEAVAEVNAGADLAITFNVKLGGINANNFTHLTTVRSWVYDATAGVEAGLRTTLDITTFTVTQNWDGDYTITLPGYGSAGATPAVAGTTFLANVNTGNMQPTATVVATLGGVMQGLTVDDQACMNCHGDNVFSGLDSAGIPLGHEDDYNPEGVEACEVCHNRTTTTETRLAQNGTRLMGYVHGIHNSHNMPGANTTAGVPVAGGVYYRNGSISATSMFSIGFPGYMNNCSTCHTAAALPAIASKPVSWQTCMSCHIGPPTTAGVAAGMAWAGFGVANTGTDAVPVFSFGGTNHANFISTTNCAGCHDDVIAPATIASFHNGLRTERGGLLWDGADQAVELGAAIDMQITGTAVNGTNLEITWTAAVGGSPVDPCNADVTAGPVFFGAVANATTGQVASNMSIIRSYAQANDWVNSGLTGSTSPGQPAGSTTLASTNTTCAVANTAVTVVPLQTTTATKGVVGLQGKPQVRFTAGIGTTNEVIQVRAKSPTYEFVVADGTAPAAADLRRSIVDVNLCLTCHKGSMYQHGGNRVDSTALCSMCHNPAGNEGNVRINMGVDATEAYDAKPGEAYDLRNMVHAIHSAGETGQPLVYYRTNGIYFFGTKAALAKVANWPGTGCQIVAGSGAPSAATGTQCDVANTTQVTKNHNFIEVHYPRPLSDCGACHVAGTDAVPDPTKAVALTVAVGGTTYNNLIDDVLMGPTAASCMSCHQSGVAATQFGLREHAGDFGGWNPTVFVNGRQTLIDAVTLP